MPINKDRLEPDMRIRFVGPSRPGDPDILHADENGDNGTTCVVHKVMRNCVSLLPESNPEADFNVDFTSGLLYRFVVVSELKDALIKTMREVDAEVKHYQEATKDHREAWAERQLTQDERDEREKRKEVAAKLMQLRERDQQKKRQ